jgi:hypothetical protein
MTEPAVPAAQCCVGMSADLVAAYARGTLTQTAAWSVEAHLPGCERCREVLADEVDPERIARNRVTLMTRLALAERGPAEAIAVRCGVPQHIWRLLSLVPSLRLSWLAGVSLVLAMTVGLAHLLAAAHAVDHALLPFLYLGPLVPLAAVAAAFHAEFDPWADLSAAAPLSGIWLFYIRSVAVIASSIIPIMLAGLALPGTAWLSLTIVLPSLAICVLSLALGTLISPLSSAIVIGTGWLAIVTELGLVAGSPATAYGGAAQTIALLATAAGGTLLAARRRSLDYGWKR